MSFYVAVTVSDGRAEVTTAGELPDGKLEIHGHSDQLARSLTLVQRGPGGLPVQQASSTYHEEQ